MRLLILATQWGLEHLHFEEFIVRIKAAGFNGIDTWAPENTAERKEFIRLLETYQLPLVCHQHRASGNTIREFCRSFEYELNLCMECGPLLINSHSGRDYFSMDDQLRVIDTAAEFSARNSIRIVHETHRGRIGYSPYNAWSLFNLRPEMRVTADLSHWVCVTESYLENVPEIVEQTVLRAGHVHARVGHPQGPQVPDPRVPRWQHATTIFMDWWARILKQKRLAGETLFTVTPEFGPPPYMQTDASTGKPAADQFELNCFIKDRIRDLSSHYDLSSLA